MAILTVEDLSFTYPNATQPTLKHISFSVEEGDFTAICGATGSGKSTLMRMLKTELTPQGTRTGRLALDGIPFEKLSPKESARSVGYVMQRPEQQIVTDKVWHELAFGLENMGVPPSVIRRRIAEMAAYFGIEHWYDQKTADLSGGQKQLLNLASVMVMQPRVLILDEPTAQLDPIAASEFITTLKKLNDDLALTVIIVEHRLEEIAPLCNKILCLDHGEVSLCTTVRNAIEQSRDCPALLGAMPSAVRLYHAVNGHGECPLTVREGRRFIERHIRSMPTPPSDRRPEHSASVALECREIYYRYQKQGRDVLDGLNLTVYRNEIFCILGGNGSGKTTALRAICGLIKPYSGQIRLFGKRLGDYKHQSLYDHGVSLLPQDVQTLFLKDTVSEELEGIREPFDIHSLYNRHPYDLSGGEQQLVALAKVLATKPRLLLMDEPTKGLDADNKQRFIQIINALKSDGITVVIVTHDVELAASCADRCAMVFRGHTVSVDDPRTFFSENAFYTTAVSRMTRGYLKNAVNVEDAAPYLCGAHPKGGDGI